MRNLFKRSRKQHKRNDLHNYTICTVANTIHTLFIMLLWCLFVATGFVVFTSFFVAVHRLRNEHWRKITTIILIMKFKKPLEHQWRLCFPLVSLFSSPASTNCGKSFAWRVQSFGRAFLKGTRKFLCIFLWFNNDSQRLFWFHSQVDPTRKDFYEKCKVEKILMMLMNSLRIYLKHDAYCWTRCLGKFCNNIFSRKETWHFVETTYKFRNKLLQIWY